MYSINIKNIPYLDFPGRKIKLLIGGKELFSDNMTLGITEVPCKSSVPKHTHEEEEIIYILEGIGEVCFEESLVNIMAGDAVILPKNKAHSISNTGRDTLKFLFCFSPIHPIG